MIYLLCKVNIFFEKIPVFICFFDERFGEIIHIAL